MKHVVKFYISSLLSFLFGIIGYKKGLDKLKKWIEY